MDYTPGVFPCTPLEQMKHISPVEVRVKAAAATNVSLMLVEAKELRKGFTDSKEHHL